MSRDKLLLAHRGYSAVAPENTKLAFDLAYQFGFDGVELDVHLTKDQQLVIIHDETTTRTSLKEFTIKDATLKELKELDFGKFWKYDLPKQTILTLEEFLDLYIDKFKIINIEIKTDEYHYPGIELRMAYLLKKYSQEQIDKLIFSSFNFKSLELIYSFNDKLTLAFLWWKAKQFKDIKPSQFSIIKYFNPWIDIYEKHQTYYDSFKKKYLFWTIKSEKNHDDFKANKKTFALISNYLF
ncbi:glycerophosphodiester phosphodiesterase family protein [Mycoplasmopsis agassizii]|uniref:glycerophosphodiester phosphodiesterase family protein n=1 Tax=Mycoplasmopsis agassizii TaxID=33922 RepID=UPI0035297534